MSHVRCWHLTHKNLTLPENKVLHLLNKSLRDNFFIWVVNVSTTTGREFQKEGFLERLTQWCVALNGKILFSSQDCVHEEFCWES